MDKLETLWITSVATAALFLVGTAQAVTIPFTEDFDVDAAGWEDADNNPLFWEPSDSVDGGAYASADFNYFGYSSPFGGGPVIFRGNDSDMASGGAFVGDWLTEGVTLVTAWVRHDSPENLAFFMRIANAFNFPGAVINGTQSVAPNTWTQVLFVVDPNSPLCVGETVSCAVALSDVGNIQFGTDAPAVLTGLDQVFEIDIDKVHVVPEPNVGILLGAGMIFLGLIRRQVG